MTESTTMTLQAFKNSKQFKWHFDGPLARQHSSIFFKDNEIFVFDNSGGFKEKGTTRVASIDMKTNEVKTVFPRENVELPSPDFYTKTGGFIKIHPDRSRMMVAFTYPAGFIWEVDIATGEVLWEYRNITPIGSRFLRIPIYTALFIEDLSFPLNKGRFK